MNYYVFFFILCLVFIVTVFVTYDNSHDYSYRDECSSDDDCVMSDDINLPKGKCVYDPDFSKKVCIGGGDKICNVSGTELQDDNNRNRSKYWEKTGLTACVENEDCNVCKNMPQWGCYKNATNPTPNDIINVNAKEYNGEFFCPDTHGDIDYTNVNTIVCVDSAGKTIYPKSSEDSCDSSNRKVPTCKMSYPSHESLPDDLIQKYNITNDTNVGYCMPITNNADGVHTCNKFTSDIILTNHDSYSSEWGCFCKNPNMFDHEYNLNAETSASSNCIKNKTCSGKGTLYVQPNDPDPLLVRCKSNDQCGNDQKCCKKNSDTTQYHGRVCLNDTLKNEIDEDEEEGSWVCHDKWVGEGEGEGSGSGEVSDWVTNGKCDCDVDHVFLQGKSNGTNFLSGGDEYSAYKICEPDICHKPEYAIGFTSLTAINAPSDDDEDNDDGVTEPFSCDCGPNPIDNPNDTFPQPYNSLAYPVPKTLLTTEGQATPVDQLSPCQLDHWRDVDRESEDEDISKTLAHTCAFNKNTPKCLLNPCGNLGYVHLVGEDKETLQCKCVAGAKRVTVEYGNWLGEKCVSTCSDSVCGGKGPGIRGICSPKFFTTEYAPDGDWDVSRGGVMPVFDSYDELKAYYKEKRDSDVVDDGILSFPTCSKCTCPNQQPCNSHPEDDCNASTIHYNGKDMNCGLFKPIRRGDKCEELNPGTDDPRKKEYGCVYKEDGYENNQQVCFSRTPDDPTYDSVRGQYISIVKDTEQNTSYSGSDLCNMRNETPLPGDRSPAPDVPCCNGYVTYNDLVQDDGSIPYTIAPIATNDTLLGAPTLEKKYICP